MKKNELSKILIRLNNIPNCNIQPSELETAFQGDDYNDISASITEALIFNDFLTIASIKKSYVNIRRKKSNKTYNPKELHGVCSSCGGTGWKEGPVRRSGKNEYETVSRCVHTNK